MRGRWRAVDIDTRKVRRRAARKTGAPPPGMAAAAAASSGGGGARTHHLFPLHHQQLTQQQHQQVVLRRIFDIPNPTHIFTRSNCFQQSQQHPIHIPLSAMGFSDNHIAVAIRTLREYFALVCLISQFMLWLCPLQEMSDRERNESGGILNKIVSLMTRNFLQVFLLTQNPPRRP